MSPSNRVCTIARDKSKNLHSLLFIDSFKRGQSRTLPPLVSLVVEVDNLVKERLVEGLAPKRATQELDV